MSIETLSDRQYAAPAAADGVLLTFGSAWANTAYGEIDAATSAASILTGLTVRPDAAGWLDGSAAVFDAATGAAGAEVVIAAFCMFNGVHAFSGGAGWDQCGYLPATIGIDNIATATRIAVRGRKQSGDAGACRVSVTYLKKPLTGTFLATANALLALPSASDPFLLPDVAGGPAWGNGAWVEFEDATPSAWIVVGLAVYIGYASLNYEVDLATGAGGSEVVRTTQRGHNVGSPQAPCYVSFSNPLDVIPISTRVAARHRNSDNVFGLTLNVAAILSYFNSPL